MQTRKGSLVESLAGTAIGFIISLLVWQFIVRPWWHLQTSFVENLEITTLFTVVSIARGYFVRRMFNMLHKKEQA
jgi:hypothetical protein